MKTKNWFFIFAILVGVLCWGTTWRIILQAQTVLGASTDLSSSQIIALTNLRRTENGLSPLTPDDTLSRAAQAKLTDMINQHYFAHLDPQGLGSWQFLDQNGYRYYYAGENLARNFPSSLAVVDAWMKSDSHRDNLLNPNYTHIGVALSESGANRYIVQLLAAPLPANLSEADSQARPFSYSAPLVGTDLWSNNYFFSTLILSLTIVIFVAVLVFSLGQKLFHWPDFTKTALGHPRSK